jgi:hypothetical protein
MERILPGLVLAGVAGLVSINTQNKEVNDSTTPYKNESSIIMTLPDKPEVEDTQKRHGFVPSQEFVCEPVK